MDEEMSNKLSDASDVGYTEKLEAFHEQLERLEEENAKLRCERDDLEAHLRSELSFSSVPSVLQVGDVNSLDASMDDLTRRVEEIARTAADRALDLDGTQRSEVVRELCEVIVAQDEVIKELNLGDDARQQAEDAIADLNLHLEEMRGAWEHEAEVNADLRRLCQQTAESSALEVSERKEEVAKLIQEKEQLLSLLDREKELAARQHEELSNNLRRANADADRERANANAEREERRAAEIKIRTYVHRLEEYQAALQKARAENDTRKKNVKKAIADVHARVDSGHTLPNNQTPLMTVEEILDLEKFDKENNLHENVEAVKPSNKVVKKDEGILRDLRERQRRANKLLRTLTRSAEKDLDQARLQSGTDGAMMAKQIEDYISGLRTASKKLHTSRTNASPPLASINTVCS